MADIILIVMVITVAALVLGLVVIETISLSQQQVDARGCTPGSIPFNASEGRCFRP
jgi:hypothetical protein